MICAPRSSRSRCVIALTAPRVPTGMKTGVSTTPCAVRSTPRRACPSVWVTSNPNGIAAASSSQLPASSFQLPVSSFQLDISDIGYRLSVIGFRTSDVGRRTSDVGPRTSVLYSGRVKRLRVGVLYGGRWGKRDASLGSGASVSAPLDRPRYEPVPIRIEKDGRWALADKPPAVMIAGDVIEQARLEAARPVREGREVHFVARP